MRFAVLVCLLSLVSSASVAQSDPYQWVGATTVAYDGGGNGLGFVGMTTQCRADFGPGARMCKSAEIMDSDTLNLNAIPAAGCWVRPVFVPTGDSRSLDVSGQGSQAEFATCDSWKNTIDGGGTWRGLTLTATGGFDTEPCDVPRSVACCKPTPVPAPISSLSLPIGVGALAGLSMLKGDA